MSKPPYSLRPLSENDRQEVMAIYNDYIEHSYAAYPQKRLDVSFYDRILSIIQGYPSAAFCLADGELVGFGFMHAYHPMPAFSRTAEISYFIRQDETGKGYGRIILDYLLSGAREKNLSCILASISSRNEASLKFHRKHGFTECGRFLQVGEKFGQAFDVIWMQLLLEDGSRP